MRTLTFQCWICLKQFIYKRNDATVQPHSKRTQKITRSLIWATPSMEEEEDQNARIHHTSDREQGINVDLSSWGWVFKSSLEIYGRSSPYLDCPSSEVLGRKDNCVTKKLFLQHWPTMLENDILECMSITYVTTMAFLTIYKFHRQFPTVVSRRYQIA